MNSRMGLALSDLLRICLWIGLCHGLTRAGAVSAEQDRKETSGNPVFSGWYADPEGVVFGDTYWIYPTTSARYRQQVCFDGFSSPDPVHWTRHERVLDSSRVTWARQAMWAPSVVEKGGRYFFFFGANDIQHDAAIGGIGVAVADDPAGPFRDYLGKPLIDEFHNGAQPIDQFVFKDHGEYYMVYGGYLHRSLAVQ
jgi:beta-xylosidase